MTDKIILTDLASLQNDSTAIFVINNNSAVIEEAFNNTLSRDGTAPNQMQNVLDMNGNQVLNLPTPSTSSSPLRLQELEEFLDSGTVTLLPTGGTAGQVLSKNSNTDFDVHWSDEGVNLTGDVTSVGKVTTISSVLGVPGTFGSATQTPVVTATAKGQITAITNQTITPAVGSITGLGTGVSAFLATPSSANLITAVTGETGTGALVFGTTPTLVTPILGAATATSINGSTVSPGQYSGTTTNNNATAGNIGEFVTAQLLSASQISLTTSTAANITSISLTAGDWDVWGVINYAPGASTVTTDLVTGVNTTSATIPTVDAMARAGVAYGAGVTGGLGTGISSPVARFSLASTTTVFLVGFAAFTTSTMQASGWINARRAR